MGLLVIDTNSILRSLPRRSCYHDFWLSLFDGRNTLCVSNEILEEYEEIIELKTNSTLASNVIKAIINNRHTLFVSPYFKFNLITVDPDDNKFIDCAIAAGAKFIVTEDQHFNVLKEIDFPKVEIVSLEEAKALDYSF